MNEPHGEWILGEWEGARLKSLKPIIRPLKIIQRRAANTRKLLVLIK